MGDHFREQDIFISIAGADALRKPIEDTPW